MAKASNIDSELTQLRALQTLVRVYEEIASFRMKRIRQSVLKNREFLKEINGVFEEVRLSYAREVRDLARKKGKPGAEKITFLAHNGKTVAILLSANTGLYGDIVKKTFDLFLSEVVGGKVEATIVGRHGLSLFLAEDTGIPYTYFDLPDSSVTPEDLDKIVGHIVQYEEIHVYYGEFLNVIKQDPAELTISAEISLKDQPGKARVKYIFEPNLKKILSFFETEIFASLFEQAVREGQLAKFASRVMAMNRAEENINEELKDLVLEKLRVTHQVSNRKQLNSLASTLKVKWK